MDIISQILARFFPGRQKRKWKFVSRRRQVSSIVILMLLVVFVYGGWFFTRSDFVRRNAVSSLEKMTGCRVQIESASLGFFDGVKMTGVKLTLRENGDEPFFSADDLRLKFDLWALITTQKIKPTSIRCSGFELTNTRYLDTSSKTKTDTMDKLLKSAKSKQQTPSEPRLPKNLKLPRIELINGHFRAIENKGDIVTMVYDEPVRCVLEPTADNHYELTIAETDPRKARESHITLDLDINSGKIAPVSGTLVNPLVYFVPGPYYDWIDQYGLRGEFQHQAGPDNSSIYHIRNVSVKIPESQGGFTLAASQGKLVFSKAGVKLENIVGKIREIKSSDFTISGKFEGYSKVSPFEINAKFKSFVLPDAKLLKGPVVATVKRIHRIYKPGGASELDLKFTRNKNREFAFAGIARPQNMTGTYKPFDLPVTNITGEVRFTNRKLEKLDLYAQRGQTRFRVTGSVAGYYKHAGLDLTIAATRLPFDKPLYDALVNLNSKYADTWKTVSPEGEMDAKVKLTQIDRDPILKADIDAMPKGSASMTYSGFKYKLRNLSGLVTLRGDTVKIHKLESFNGSMFASFAGEITGLQKNTPGVDIDITAQKVSVDKKLVSLLPASAQKYLSDLKFSAQAGLLTGKLLLKPGGKFDYNFNLSVNNASLNYKKFPYALKNGSGKIFIKPDLIEVDNLIAKHGKSTVDISAEFLPHKNPVEYIIDITGKQIAFDKQLENALPADAKKQYRKFAPTGVADILAQVATSKTPQKPDEYIVKITPQNASIKFSEFPYPLHKLVGAVVLTPNAIHLDNVKFTNNKMKGSVAGKIELNSENAAGALNITLAKLPIDNVLLSAMPASWKILSQKFKPGGTCSIYNGKFNFSQILRNPKKPRSKSNTQWNWKLLGKVVLNNANVDLGLGKHPITGSFDGVTEHKAGKLILNSKVALAKAKVGNYAMTNLTATMTKSQTSDVIHFADLFGRVFDGVIAGRASARLQDSLSYGMRMEFKDVNLQKFVNAGEPDRKKWSNVTGKLSGKIDIAASAKKSSENQAVGELIISDAKMYKLPVILDVLNVIYLTVPGDSAFNRGVISYHLKGNKLFLREIHLSGQTISVLGSGTMDIKTGKLNLTFLTGQSGKLPRLQNVSDEILRALLKEIVEIRVTGTMKKPKMETINLRSVRELMERLIIKLPE